MATFTLDVIPVVHEHRAENCGSFSNNVTYLGVNHGIHVHVAPHIHIRYYWWHILANPGGEDGISGWTVETGTLATRAADPAPKRGSAYFYGDSVADCVASQEVDLLGDGITAAQIDAGKLRFCLRAWCSSWNTDDQTELQIRFLNAARATLETHKTGLYSMEAALDWGLRECQASIPENTRYVDVIIRMFRVAGVANNGHIDWVHCFTYFPSTIKKKTDFSEYTTGLAPSDWTERWSAGHGAPTVTADGTSPGGKRLTLVTDANAWDYALTWDALDDLCIEGMFDQIDILVLFQAPTCTECAAIIAMCAGTDHPASAIQSVNYYEAGGQTGSAFNADVTNDQVQMRGQRMDATRTHVTAAKSITAGNRYWMRLRFEPHQTSGITKKCRVWAYPGTEPSTWDLDNESHISLNRHGQFGVGDMRATNKTYYFDYFAIALGGEEADSPWETLEVNNGAHVLADDAVVLIYKFLTVQEAAHVLTNDAVPFSVPITVAEAAHTMFCATRGRDDTFTGSDGDAPNPQIWDETDASNILDIQSNQLNIAGAGAGDKQAGIFGTWVLTGDFEIIVDFSVTTLDAPAASVQYACGLRIWWNARAGNAGIGRARSTATNGYYKGSTADAWAIHPEAHSSGRLKLKRVGNTVTAWIWDVAEGEWEWDENANGYTFSDNIAGDVEIEVWGKQENNENLDIDWDNFTIVYGAKLDLWQRLGVNSCYHEHEPDEDIILDVPSITLVMSEPYNLHVADNVVIDPATVYPAAAYHLHVPDNVTLVGTLIIQEAAHVVDSPLLPTVLTVQEYGCVVTNDAIPFTLTPTVQEAAHVLTNDALKIDYPHLHPADIAHVHAGDNVTITTEWDLVVQEVAHVLYSDPSGLESNGVHNLAPHETAHVMKSGGDWRNWDFRGANGSDPSIMPWWRPRYGNRATSMTIQSNKLNYNRDTGTSLDYAYLEAFWRFDENENFDIQFDFDYSLFENPTAYWTYAARFYLADEDNAAVWFHLARARNGSNGYLTQDNGGWSAFNQADTSGKLRVRRVNNNTIRFQVWNTAGYWEWNSGGAGTYSERSQKCSGRMRVVLGVRSYGIYGITSNMDNFRVNASNLSRFDKHPDLRLSYSTDLVVQEAFHVHTADQANVWTPFLIQEAFHVHAIDNIVLISPDLIVQEAYHVLTNDAITGFDLSIGVDEAYHILTDDDWLWINDAFHAHAGDNIPAFDITLNVAECAHVHEGAAADPLTIFLTVNECGHETWSTNIPNFASNLVVQSAFHTHAPDPVALTQKHTLVVLECVHVHIPESPSLLVILGLADCFHLHVLPPPAEVKLVVTPTVAEAAHILQSDHISLASPGVLQDLDSSHSVYSDAPQLVTETTIYWGKSHLAPDVVGTISAQCCYLSGVCYPPTTGKAWGCTLYLTGVAIYVDDLHDDQVRLAVYKGGTLDDPLHAGEPDMGGADLVNDFGLTAGVGTDQYLELTVADIEMDKTALYWPVFKADHDNKFKYGYDWFDKGDFEVDGLWSPFKGVGGVSYDEAVAYDDPMPSHVLDGWNNDQTLLLYLKIKAINNIGLVVKPGASKVVSDLFQITEKEMLPVLDAHHVHAADTINLAQHFLTIAECYHIHAVDATLAIPLLAVNECGHEHAVDNVPFVLATHDVAHVLTDDAPLDLDEVYTLNPHEQISMVITDDEVVLTQEHELGVWGAINLHACDVITLSVTLAVNEAHHIHEPDIVSLALYLTVQDAFHVHFLMGSEEGFDLLEWDNLTVSECNHATASDTPALTQEHTLADLESFHVVEDDLVRIYATVDLEVVQEAGHELTDDGPNLIVQLAQLDAYHVSTNDAFALTQDHTLALQESAHVLFSDNVPIIVPITVQEAAQPVTSDSLISLSQAHFLAVVGLFHLVITDPILLFQLHFLEVAGTSQNIDYNYFVLTSDSVEFAALEAGLAGKFLTIVEWGR
jgi:hypothetical protein